MNLVGILDYGVSAMVMIVIAFMIYTFWSDLKLRVKLTFMLIIFPGLIQGIVYFFDTGGYLRHIPVFSMAAGIFLIIEYRDNFRKNKEED